MIWTLLLKLKLNDNYFFYTGSYWKRYMNLRMNDILSFNSSSSVSMQHLDWPLGTVQHDEHAVWEVAERLVVMPVRVTDHVVKHARIHDIHQARPATKRRHGDHVLTVIVVNLPSGKTWRNKCVIPKCKLNIHYRIVFKLCIVVDKKRFKICFEIYRRWKLCSKITVEM